MTDKERDVPPDVPWRTFETYIDGLRTFGPYLPTVIDRDSMRTLPGVTQTGLLNTLRTLKLIDEDGGVQPRLRQIVNASPAQRRSLYQQIIADEYTFLRGLDLQNSTPAQIETAFNSAGAAGATVRRCIAFFVGMVNAAGVPISPAITKAWRRHATNSRRHIISREVDRSMPVDAAHLPTIDNGGGTIAKPTFQILYELLDSDMDKNEQEAVWTLLQYVRRKETVK
jgi:hypothetical protein